MGKTWTEEDMKQALEKTENRSVSIRAPVKKYGMTEGTLRMQIKMKKENKSLLVEVDPKHLIKMSKRN